MVKRLDIKPLDPEGGKRGIGKDATKVWKAHLREITRKGGNGDPVANNALSKDGVRHDVPPGFFAQVPERLGRWRDDFGNLEAAGTDNTGVTKAQWVPESVVRRKEKEQRQKEEKARRDAAERERYKIEQARREQAAREKAEADAELAAARDAKNRAKRDEEDRAAAERRRKNEEKKREEQKARMERLMRKGAVTA